MKNISILGSTGSIGTNALDVVAGFPDRFQVKALTAKSNIALLAEQIKKFSPAVAVVYDEEGAQRLEDMLPEDTAVGIHYGDEGYRIAATLPEVHTVLTAMVGAAGLKPTVAAIRAGKTIALANKETLVMAGELVMKMAADHGVDILPVDSEHSAIFQCLQGNRREDLKRLIITASGGPFFKRDPRTFDTIQPSDALKHPNWQMGSKITIDSATLMNKGLEVIEAKHLFGVDLSMIDVVVHPQSIIHSMVAYRDGSIMAQLGVPDMKSAIALALSHPERLPLGQPLPDFSAIGGFTFAEPDLKTFPCLALAMEACRMGGTVPAAMNAANEIAVAAFLEGGLPFTGISGVIRETMARLGEGGSPSLEAIMAVDRAARLHAAAVIAAL
ncbi:MAG: 1-deoxy-D-xylulose-5-phosphate reductoisomerase [Deltaproteobacteria bacterium]|nr:1-deoxy-D-xylulose-5-phosphate reductoisomerase [Deltaproteobacteria bacterium]